MSSIDERIVQMQFKNSQFEKGVAESTKSLEKFKKQLEFKEEERSISSLQKAGDSFSLARMAEGIENISAKFSTLGVIGRRVLENLTDSAFRAGEAFIRSVSVDQISAGFSKYEADTKAVQTIMMATGETIEEVESQLEKVMMFTDETSYSYADMVSTIGKFTASGMKLKPSREAVQGLELWAASAGKSAQEATRAAYNISQAMSLGALTWQDWVSIQGLNMNTPQFMKTAIETAKALGTLNKEGKTLKGTAVNVSNFGQTLSERWLTKDVLLETLRKYGSYSEEVLNIMAKKGIPASQAMELVSGDFEEFSIQAWKAGQEARTFTDAIDSVKDAVSSGWMTTFKLIFGNYTEATKLWTDFANDLWEIFASGAEARNELLAGWKEQGGRDDLISGLTDAMTALKSLIDAVKEAFHSIFPETTVQDIKAISSGIKDFGKNLKDAFTPMEQIIGWKTEIKETTRSGMEELNEELKRGSRGDGVKKLQERLIELGYDVGRAGVDGILGPDTEKALNQFKKDTGLAIDGLYDEATHKALGKALGIDEKTIKTIEKVPITIEKIPPKLQWLKNILSGVFAVLDIGRKILSFFWNVIRSIGNTLSPIAGMMAKIADAASRFFVAVNERLGKSTVFTRWLTSINNVLGPVKTKIEELCQAFLDLLGIGGDLDKIDFANVVDNLFTSIKNLFGIGLDSDSITEGLDTKNIIDTIKGKITEIYTGIRDWIISVFSKNGTGEVAGGFKLDGYKIGLGAVSVIVAMISSKLIQFASVTVKAAKEITRTLTNVRKISAQLKNKLLLGNAKSGFEVISEGVMKLAIGIGILAASLYFLSQLSWDKIAVGLVGLVSILGMVIGTVFALKYAAKGFNNMDKVAEVVLKIGEAIAAMAITVTMLGALSWSELARGLVGTAVLFGACIGALAILSKIKVNVKEVSGLIGIIGSLALALGQMTGIVKRLGSLDTSSLIKGFVGLGAMLLSLGVFMKALGKIRVSPANALALLTSTIAIDGLVLGFLLLSYSMKLLKPGDIAKGIVGLGAIILGLASLLKLTEKIHPNVGAILSLLPAAIAIDLLIGGFIAMIVVMRMVKAGEVVKAFAGTMTIVLGLAALLKLIEKIHPSVGSILSLLPAAIAIDLLIVGFIALVYTMKKIPVKDIVKAFAGLSIIVFAMSRATKIISKNKPSIRGILSLIPVALALDLVIGGFIALAIVMKTMDAKTILKTVIAFTAILYGFSILTKSLSNAASSLKSIRGILALIPMVLAMTGIMAAFVLFAKSMGDVSYKSIIKALVGLAAIVISMKAMTKASSGLNVRKALSVLVSGAALAGVMYTFALALNKIKGIKTDTIMAFALGLSALMTVMAVVGAISGGNPLGSFLGIVSIAAGLAVVMAAFTALLSIPEVQSFLNGGAEKIGILVGKFIGSMKAAELESFANAAASMGNIQTVDQSKVNNAIAAAQAVANFGAGLPKKTLVNKAVDFIFGSELKQFSGDMVSFGNGFNSFAQELSKVNETPEELEEKTGYAIRIANSIKTFGESLQEKTISKTIVDAIFGSELSQFSGDMVAFGAGFNSFATQMKGVDDPGQEFEDKTEFAIKIAKAINSFGETLANKTVAETIVEGIFGSELNQFSGDMAGFATGFNSFSKQMLLVEDPGNELETKTKSAVRIASSINEFAKGLADKTISETIVEGLFGSELAQFSGDMGSFSEGVNSFATQILKISDPSNELEDKTAYAVRIAKAINSFAGELSKNTVSETIVEGIFGSELEQFSGDIPGFAVGFRLFANQMKLFEDPGNELEEKTGYAVRIAESVNQFAGKLGEKTFGQAFAASLFGSSLNQFMGDMPVFAQKIKEYGEKIKDFEDPGSEIDEKTGYAVRIVGSINELSAAVGDKSFGQALTDTVFGSAFAQFNSDMTDFADKFNTYAETIINVNHDPQETEDATRNAVGIATQIADFMKQLKDLNIEREAGLIKGLFTDETAFNTVVSGIGELGKRLNESADSFVQIQSKGLTKEVMQNAVDSLKNVASLMNYLSGANLDLTYTDYTGFGDALEKSKVDELLDFIDKIGERVLAFSDMMSGVDIVSISNIMSSISQLLMMLSDGSFVITPETVNSIDLTALDTMLSSIPPHIDQYAGDFQASGFNLVSGLVSGLTDSEEFALRAMERLANNLIARFKAATGIASPSKVMAVAGRYFVEGLAKGIGDNESQAVSATGSMASSMLDTASGTLMSLSQLLAKDIDVDPVISPVLDLTNFNATAATMDSTLSGRTMDLYGRSIIGNPADLASSLAMNMSGLENARYIMDQYSRMAASTPTDQPSVTDAVRQGFGDVNDSVSTLNERIASLETAISNMKVVTDTGALIGQIDAGIDQRLGEFVKYRGRGM